MWPGLLLVILVLMTSLLSAASEKPNILFILTDDQGWATLSCYGSKRVATPHLDTIAREGARFTDAYVMPQCTPTRAALLTGQHTARNGMWHVIPWYGTPWAPVREPMFAENLSRETPNLPKSLRAAGYTTGTAGKWHLTTNADGSYVALKAEAATHYGFDFCAPPGPGSPNDGDKHVDYLTDHALAFIKANADRPWFFYLAHHTVHGRVSAPPALIEKHLAAGAPAKGLHNATYLAALEHLDNSVGRLMAGIDELKLRERTVVVFLSDNGGVFRANDMKPYLEGPGTATQLKADLEEFSNAPLRAGKGSPYEGGLRVPCLVRWPGVVAPGLVSATPIHVVDWMPTLLEVAAAPAPERHTLDGTSLVPLLRGGQLGPRALFWHLPLYDLRWGATPCAVVREGEWKLIEYFGDRVDAKGLYRTGAKIELFNLRRDPGEALDIADREPARVLALKGRLHAWLAACGAEIPGANPNFDPTRSLKEVRTKPAHLQAQTFSPSGAR